MRSFLPILTLSVIAVTSLAQVIPSWWTSRDVFEPGAAADDFVAVNQGQLKNFAKAAYQEFEERLPDGAGGELDALIQSWDTSIDETDDYQVVSASELKTVVDVFYRRLDRSRASLVPSWRQIESPWASDDLENDKNKEVVNVGQVKQQFYILEGDRADYSVFGTDQPEPAYNFGLSWLADTDADGVWDYEEIVFGTDPNDPGSLPPLVLEVISGAGQRVKTDAQASSPLVIRVLRASRPVSGVEVSFAVGSTVDNGLLAPAMAGAWETTISAESDAAGQVSVYWKPSAVPGAYLVSADAASASVSFNLTAYVDAMDFYQGMVPILSAQQGFETGMKPPVGSPSAWLDRPVELLVTNQSGVPVSGAPVHFAVTHGDGLIRPYGATSENWEAAGTVTLVTDLDGRIRLDWQMGGQVNCPQVLHAFTLVAAGFQSETFLAYSGHSLDFPTTGRDMHLVAHRGIVNSGNSNLVEAWVDTSAAGRIASATGKYRPTLELGVANSPTWIKFNGSQRLGFSDPLPVAGGTWFAMVKPERSRTAHTPSVTNRSVATAGGDNGGQRYLFTAARPTGKNPWVHTPQSGGQLESTRYFSRYTHKYSAGAPFYNYAAYGIETRRSGSTIETRYDVTPSTWHRGNSPPNVPRMAGASVAQIETLFKQNKGLSNALNWTRSKMGSTYSHQIPTFGEVFVEDYYKLEGRTPVVPASWDFDEGRIGSVAPGFSVGTNGAGFYARQSAYAPPLGSWSSSGSALRLSRLEVNGNRRPAAAFNGGASVQEVALPAGQFTNWETVGAPPGGGQGFVGKVAEIMHFNTILSPQLADAVEDQMGARYQTPFPDRDGDGLPDWWERALIAERANVAPTGHADGDQWTNLQEFQAGTHPGLVDSDHDGLLDHEEAALGTSPICFDTDRDGYPDGIDTAPVDASNGRADLDENGIPDGMDYLTSADSRLKDTDGDGLSDFVEVYLSFSSPVLFDSDGDLLPDGFEFYSGLNPHSAGGADGQTGDPDGDGVDNFNEYLHQTNPNSADTDGDGVSDAQEIAQGSDPNNSGDGGAPPPVPPVEISFKVGDPSGSHSERWMMMIEGSGRDTRRFNFAARSWGEVETQGFKLLPGAEYKVTLRHLSTDPEHLETFEKADYDWAAAIDSKPGVVVEEPGAEGTVFVIAKEGSAWVVDNPGGLLTEERHGDDDNLTVGKTARLLPVEIVVPDDTNPPLLAGNSSETPVAAGLDWPENSPLSGESTASTANSDPEIITTQFKVAVELKVAKLENSLGAGHNPAITFSQEPDHFRVRVKGSELQNLQNCAVSIESFDSDGTPDTTQKTSLLKWNANQQGLLSEAMLLVSDYDDRDGARDETYLPIPKRVIKVSPGGEVKLTGITLNGEKHDTDQSIRLAAIRKTIPVTVKILSNAGGVGGTAETVRALAMEDIRRANERLLQVGLQIEATPQIIEAPLTIPGSFPYMEWADNGSNEVSDHEKDVSKLGTPADGMDFVVFYLYGIIYGSTTEELSGISRFNTSDNNINNNVYVSFNRHKPYTLIHELVHVFTKMGHYGGTKNRGNGLGFDYSPAGGVSKHKVEHNLMFEADIGDVRIESSKRIYRQQESWIYETLGISSN